MHFKTVHGRLPGVGPYKVTAPSRSSLPDDSPGVATSALPDARHGSFGRCILWHRCSQATACSRRCSGPWALREASHSSDRHQGSGGTHVLSCAIENARNCETRDVGDPRRSALQPKYWGRGWPVGACRGLLGAVAGRDAPSNVLASMRKEQQ